jgi:uracil-DNA glycosylase
MACSSLISKIHACTICAPHLAHGVRPVLQFHPKAKILIAGQAPGSVVHKTGVPFDDASGKRLREWLGISTREFYDPRLFAILPMGFCYPGSSKSGDLPPRPECAPAWRSQLMSQLNHLQLTLVIGKYAQDYHFGQSKILLTERVKQWRDCWPEAVPLPHPSPRNNPWLRRNPWFETDLIPLLQKRVANLLEK